MSTDTDELGDERTKWSPWAIAAAAILVLLFGLIAFGTRHPGFFNGNQGPELLTFLARVLEHCIRGWLDLPE